MGRWSRHPMGSDGALDAQYAVTNKVTSEMETEGKDYFDLYDEYRTRMQIYLANLTLEELEEMKKHTDNNDFVIPYTFVQFEVTPKKELYDNLKECLSSHDDITGPWNYCGEKTEDGEIVELAHLRLFRENFESIIEFNIELPDDPGLFAAMAEGKDNGGLINKL